MSGRGRSRSGGDRGNRVAAVAPRGRCRAVVHATDQKRDHAAVAVTEKKWGTRLDWTCDYLEDWVKAAPGYDIVVTTVEGAESAVGTSTARIHAVDIRVSGTHEPLAVTTMR